MVSSSGLVHPLNGIDHLSAMVAVGVYSVQLGGRGVYAVPISFLLAMLIGGVIGFEQYILYYTELGIALSVVLLGMAIGMRSNISLWLAVTGVGVFGICHGYAHGVELPLAEDQVGYAVGFMLTTGILHLLGAVVAHIIKQRFAQGGKLLQLFGFATAIVGVGLVFQL